MSYGFNPIVAAEFGVDGAVMIDHIMYWMTQNKGKNENFYDDRYWTYNSIRSYTTIFPFWSKRQIERVLKNLIKDDAVLVGNYNKKNYDKTNWYTLSDKTLKLYLQGDKDAKSFLSPNGDTNPSPNGEKAVPKRGKGCPQTVEPIPPTNLPLSIPTIEKINIVFSYYQTKGLVKHRALTESMEKALTKVLKRYSVEDVKLFIDRHKNVVEITRNNKFPVKVRGLDVLFSQRISNDAGSPKLYEEYLEGGSKYETYLAGNYKTESSPKTNFFGEVKK